MYWSAQASITKFQTGAQQQASIFFQFWRLAVRGASRSGFLGSSPWLAKGFLFSVSSRGLCCVHIPGVSLLRKIPNPIGFESHPVTSHHSN